ncbi:unnamed protein product [marine sediment metagenome]|uniref:Uncharacterized protein n=1 Tax=marine sediment metagenome TaxID=412755 RepID=X1SK95_9ZZZZ
MATNEKGDTMTLPEAIEILSDQSAPPELLFTSDFCTALNMSIEALEEKLERQKRGTP